MALGSVPADNELNLGMLGMHGTVAANYAVRRRAVEPLATQAGRREGGGGHWTHRGDSDEWADCWPLIRRCTRSNGGGHQCATPELGVTTPESQPAICSRLSSRTSQKVHNSDMLLAIGVRFDDRVTGKVPAPRQAQHALFAPACPTTALLPPRWPLIFFFFLAAPAAAVAVAGRRHAAWLPGRWSSSRGMPTLRTLTSTQRRSARSRPWISPSTPTRQTCSPP